MILILDFTRVCNSRCTTCDIWKTDDPKTLDMESVEKLIVGLPLSGIYVTGGEPYISPIIGDVARLMQQYHPGASWDGATNCISPKTEERLAEIQDIGFRLNVCLSLEGNREQHDRTRGIEGSYDRVIQVMEFCKARGISFYFSTLTDEGEREGRRLGVMTHHMIRRYGDRFGGIEGENPSQVIAQCPGGTAIVCCDPDGKLWACEEYRPELYIGDTTTEEFDDMRFAEVAQFVGSHSCGPCSMSCWYR